MSRVTTNPLSLSDEDLWLLQQAELGETDADLEEVYRELAALIADGKPPRGSTTTLSDGEEYE